MIIEHPDKTYTVLKELGKGHSGVVFLAEDPAKNQVAVKCLASLFREGDLKRFQQEFVLLRTLAHPHIAQPIDFGFDPQRSQYFFVTEYVEGKTLNRALIGIDEKKALEYFAQALEALDYMHRQGVYHCDLKPENILVTSEGILKIIDFDVATRGARFLGGTPTYFPPELLADIETPPSPRSDLFSLGATFYYSLTQTKPFEGKTIEELIISHAGGQPKLPSEIHPKLGRHWDDLLMGLLQSNPSHRFSTASAVLQQVYPLIGRKKSLLSEGAIQYRLSQHGVPIGKEAILSRAERLLAGHLAELTGRRRIWVIEGKSGLGASTLLDELKTLAQLKGLPCYFWSPSEPAFPSMSAPFVWVVDDLERLAKEGPEENFSKWLTKFQELHHKFEGKPHWMVFGGVQNPASLPPKLQALLEEKAERFQLEKWNPDQIKLWLKDVFQAPEPPPFLIEKLFQESGGNPKKARRLLEHYISKKLILDRQGHWRKDLHRPNPLFIEEFSFDPNLSEFEVPFSLFSSLEKKILSLLATLFEPVPGEFVERVLGKKSLSPELQKLAVLGWLSQNREKNFYLSQTGLKNFILDRLGYQEIGRRHDALLDLLGTADFRPFFSLEAIHYHMAHGSDPLLSAEGWAFFGEASARKGLGQSAFEYFSRAYDRTPKEAVERRFEYAVQRGKCLIQMNRLVEAKAFFEVLLKQFADQKKEFSALFSKIYERLGMIETKQRNYPEARAYFVEALSCLGNPPEASEQILGIKNFLAGLHLLEGDLQRAITEFQSNYREAQRLPWERRRILTNNDLGAALLKDGRFEAAVAHWKELLEDLKNREDKSPAVRCLYQMGQAYLDRGETETALSYFLQALNFSKALQNFEMELRLYNALANLFRGEDAQKSLEMYEKALEAAFQFQETSSIAVILLNMGFLLAEEKVVPRARHCLEQGLFFLNAAKMDEREKLSLLQSGHSELAQMECELGQGEESLKNARRSLQLIKENPWMEERSFEALLVLWRALMLSKHEEEARPVRSRLEKMAVGEKERKRIREVEEGL